MHTLTYADTTTNSRNTGVQEMDQVAEYGKIPRQEHSLKLCEAKARTK